MRTRCRQALPVVRFSSFEVRVHGGHTECFQVPLAAIHGVQRKFVVHSVGNTSRRHMTCCRKSVARLEFRYDALAAGAACISAAPAGSPGLDGTTHKAGNKWCARCLFIRAVAKPPVRAQPARGNVASGN